jgi:hypothetical protein
MNFFSGIPMTPLQRKFVVSSDFQPFFCLIWLLFLKNNPFDTSHVFGSLILSPKIPGDVRKKICENFSCPLYICPKDEV